MISISNTAYDTVNEWLSAEKKLEDDHGENLIFDIFRLEAVSGKKEIKHLKLGTIILPGNVITGKDTVKDVIIRLKKMLHSSKIIIEDTESLYLQVDGNKMVDHELFYADYQLNLPCWIKAIIVSATVQKIILDMT